MTRMTGKRALMETLKAEGVQYIFGNPGTSESPIMDALEGFPDIRYVLATQEGVAMGMADAYARATGKPSFVNLHIETGLANGISLLHNANEGGTPLVLSAGNKDMRELAHGRTDLAGMVRQFTKWSVEVTHPEAVPVVLQRAFNEAKTPPTGPTFVAFSADALDGEADVEIVPSALSYPHTPPDRRAIEDAAGLLAEATNPVMLVSDRVAQSGAADEAVNVAELLGAKVYASAYSEMNFPTSHSQFMGRVRLGYPETVDLLSQADVLLVVGKLASGYYMFSEPNLRYLGPKTRLVHIDQDARGVGSTQRTEVAMVADPKAALVELAYALESSMSGSAREAAKSRAVSAAEDKEAQRSAWQRRLKERWDAKPMSAERMVSELASALPPDTIVVDDAVTTGMALHSAIQFDEPGSVYGGRGGALGWGMGGAMGVKLANPDRPVVAVVGDGSAMMTVQGLWTAATENIPVVYVICNNGVYRVLKVNMDHYKTRVLKEDAPRSRYIGMDFPIPLDMAGMAEAMSVHGRKVTDPTEIGPAVREALALGKPALLDVSIDGTV
ncbi:MAG: thiamine pyrophosphate-binding protein [Chloroflexi bacterium]|nr:thiamine pyrophosphate-binding protein [Chloroflexota bacterium]